MVNSHGELLTKLSNCCRFCKLIMDSESDRRDCFELWRRLAQQSEDHFEFVTCNARLQYARANIKANGQFGGMLIAGQFFTEPPDLDEKQPRFQYLARRHGLDAQALSEAAQEISIFDNLKHAQLGSWLNSIARHLTLGKN